jgi:lipopolysaccharide biosynthesis glycosyltransferase
MDGIYHFSNAALYRLFMTQHLPTQIDRILYLDADLIFNLDISDVFIQHSNSVFSARIETEKRGYFNSGVFLTSLNYWRSNEIGKKCIEYLIQNPDSRYKDQDALNYVFSDINDSMDKRFNFAFQDYGVFKSRNLKKAIFHFTGTVKPWKNHAPPVFPVTLWRRMYVDVYGRPVNLQRVRLHRIKKTITTLKSII